ncbi:MAG: MltA domain-containing protein [Pseudomonadota bacterium]|jgi:membrane-bound lytic murein transglycosylase A
MTSRQTSPFPSPALAALGLLLSLAGSLVAQTMPASSNAGVPVVTDGDALGQPFVTKYARFQPVPFSTLPGWNTDALRESLDVFSRSCKVLSRKNAWSASCGDLTGADSGSDDGARRFFEAHFQVYQVMNPDATADGRITGYYEPQLEGRSTRNAQFRFPVYGAPRDLYQLDARSLSGASRQWFRIEDNRLLAAAPGTADAHEYELALDNDLPDLADKRYRVRLDGGRIVPYFNRQQIESQGIDAPVLAWVQDAYVLYSMQVQGSGKIKLEDGRLVRVAYAEQNGQPFLPNASSSDTAMASSAIKTRGLRLGSASAAGEAANAPTDDVASIIAQLRHGSGSDPAADPPPAASPRAATPASHTSTTPHNSDVQAIIAQLRHGNAAATGSASAAAVQPMPAAASAAAPKAHDPQVQAMIAQLLGKAPPPTAAGSFSSNAQTHVSGSDAARMAVDPHRKGVAKNIAASSGSTSGGALSGIGDPSYVFFRVIPDGPQGPLGALGVPLTAGRSLAVDPRTTPLGAPVFVTTAAPGGAGSIDRLMFAQDTGGAIRGSVRGDFFWGFGDDAGSMAASMNANGRMWLLLPKGLTLGALNPKVRTRGLGSSAAAPDCVIPDDESCVEN